MRAYTATLLALAAAGRFASLRWVISLGNVELGCSRLLGWFLGVGFGFKDLGDQELNGLFDINIVLSRRFEPEEAVRPRESPVQTSQQSHSPQCNGRAGPD